MSEQATLKHLYNMSFYYFFCFLDYSLFSCHKNRIMVINLDMAKQIFMDLLAGFTRFQECIVLWDTCICIRICQHLRKP